MIASIFQEASLPDTNTYLIISRKKYPDSETKYRDFGDGLVGIPVMIQNQMDVILKNGDINGAGGKLMYKLKKLIKN